MWFSVNRSLLGVYFLCCKIANELRGLRVLGTEFAVHCYRFVCKIWEGQQHKHCMNSSVLQLMHSWLGIRSTSSISRWWSAFRTLNSLLECIFLGLKTIGYFGVLKNPRFSYFSSWGSAVSASPRHFCYQLVFFRNNFPFLFDPRCYCEGFMKCWPWQHNSGGIEEFKMDNAGYRLTASEEYYRTQWLSTVCIISESSSHITTISVSCNVIFDSGNFH